MNAEKSRVVMQIVVSVFAMVAGFVFLATSLGDASTDKIAAAWIGAIIGYWLS